eukprot:UN15710
MGIMYFVFGILLAVGPQVAKFFLEVCELKGSSAFICMTLVFTIPHFPSYFIIPWSSPESDNPLTITQLGKSKQNIMIGSFYFTTAFTYNLFASTFQEEYTKNFGRSTSYSTDMYTAINAVGPIPRLTAGYAQRFLYLL